ncbi:SARP family transcriptional regulator [Micromonospora rosaria]|uniref:SARP family transcriptional regulator n=1 Tax=Micromonospora rosaria TaxID=47874 RepID=A0A136PNR2_9ACTN|nr:BTAD domain-containing putative transcriptional regulator [Micromonospora rosaria]KXK60075.1 SARP family transcriptional regulator [Micromonospora rosaria]
MQTNPDDPLRVSVLGPVRAWRGGRELNLGPARQRLLFAALVVAGGRDVGRDDLIAEVWGDSPPATATGSVYTYVSGLRRSLGRETLTSGPTGYAVRLRPGDLDSERFATAYAEAARRHDAGDLAAAVAALDEALGLWHGEPYAGLTGHRLEFERARLVQRRLDALGRRARLLIELGDDGVVAELTGLVRDHPLHEPLHELLVLALHRTGRRAEAVEAYRAARHTLRTELGIEPGSALTDLYDRVRRDPALTVGGGTSGSPGPSPSPARTTPGAPGAGSLAGRADELGRLRSLLDALAAGQGNAVWIEGEPGIGKTALLRAAFADAGERGCQVAWGSAEELDRYVPLQVVVRAVQPQPRSADSPVAPPPAGSHLDGFATTDPPVLADRVLARVRAACAVAPLVLVVDDLQWADPASVPFWDRLVAATRRMPLLLVAAARLEPGGQELARLRRGVRSRQGAVLRLGALPPEVVEQLVVRLVGAPLGPNLAEVVSISAGNPLYAREMTTALLRRGAVRTVDGVADIPDSVPVELPRPLLAVVRGTVDLLSPRTQDVLRTAALLGTRFSVDDVVAVTGESPFELVTSLEEALAANVLVGADTALAFRHSFLRRVLYDSIPAPARTMLHRHTAEVLARGGSPVTRVAEQLVAAASVVDDWTVSWLVAHCADLARRAPQLAGELLRRVLATGPADPRHRAQLLIALVRLDLRDDRWPLDEAREAAGLATDPAERAEMRHLLAAMTHRRGDTPAAIAILRDALADRAVPDFWRTRHWVLLADLRRGPLDDLDRADRRAAALHAEALAAGQPYEAASALQTTWLTNSVRRDHERALEYVDRALDVMRDNPAFAGLYLDLLDNRTFTLHNLDRLPEAERTLREARLFALRHRLPSGLHTASAVQYFWTGRWDDALAEISAVTDDVPRNTLLGMRDPVAVALLLHGVAALVAAHREDGVLARGHLDATDALPASDAERESCGFLLVARALVAETRDRPDEALRVVGPLLAPEYAPLAVRHQWLPEVTRLALDLGRRDVAERAAAICAAEAAREVQPARAYRAAARCRALLTDDPEPALAAAARYREMGWVTELAATLEDAAVLLAANRRPHEAAVAGGEAVDLYTMLGARWDLRRTQRRLAGYGVEPAPGRVPGNCLDAG